MRILSTLICSFFLLPFILISCKKEKKGNYNGAIQTTQKENTYSMVFCKINDTLWNDCQKLGGFGQNTSFVLSVYKGENQFKSLDIEAHNACDTIYRTIYLKLFPFYGKGIYYLNQKGGCYGAYDYFNTKNNQMFSLITDNLHTGRVEITEFDTLNRAIYGTFYFTAADSFNSVTISEGVLKKTRYN